MNHHRSFLTIFWCYFCVCMCQKFVWFGLSWSCVLLNIRIFSDCGFWKSLCAFWYWTKLFLWFFFTTISFFVIPPSNKKLSLTTIDESTCITDLNEADSIFLMYVVRCVIWSKHMKERRTYMEFDGQWWRTDILRNTIFLKWYFSHTRKKSIQKNAKRHKGFWKWHAEQSSSGTKWHELLKTCSQSIKFIFDK